MVVILAPATNRFRQRAGFASFWTFAVVAALVDGAFFLLGWHWATRPSALPSCG